MLRGECVGVCADSLHVRTSLCVCVWDAEQLSICVRKRPEQDSSGTDQSGRYFRASLLAYGFHDTAQGRDAAVAPWQEPRGGRKEGRVHLPNISMEIRC